MSTQRISEVASVVARMVPAIGFDRAYEIASIVGRGYFKVIQESEEWKACVGICSVSSLDLLVSRLLGKDAAKILEPLPKREREEFGFSVPARSEEPCFVWAWRAFYLFGTQVHHSNVTPKELVVA